MSHANEAAIERFSNANIFVAGHNGMVGSAIVRRLEAAGCENLLLKSRLDLDLTDTKQVREWLHDSRPDHVFIAAAKVGGIHANNTFPADFIYDNLMIESNLIRESYAADVTSLLFLGSSCTYPRLAPQPMPEDCLLTGPLESTNEPYALAKIAGIKLCESFNRQHGTDFRSVMPTNLYGPNDNFDLETSHVLPAMLRKFDDAKQAGAASVEIWGTGSPRREFLHVDDMADACVYTLALDRQAYADATEPMLSHLNVGTGTDVSIKELATLIREIVGFNGNIVYNTDYPDGTPRKLLDVSKLASLGWTAKISLESGIRRTYDWYLNTRDVKT